MLIRVPILAGTWPAVRLAVNQYDKALTDAAAIFDQAATRFSRIEYKLSSFKVDVGAVNGAITASGGYWYGPRKLMTNWGSEENDQSYNDWMCSNARVKRGLIICGRASGSSRSSGRLCSQNEGSTRVVQQYRLQAKRASALWLTARFGVPPSAEVCYG